MYQLLEVIDFIGLTILYGVCFLPKWKGNRQILLLKTIAYVYFVFVLYFTLMPLFIPIPFINLRFNFFNINLVPFYDFIEGHGGALKQFILNIIMMIPFGILVPIIYKKKALPTVFGAALFSLGIEFVQLLSPRKLNSFDVTDIIANTIGGLIGYIIYRITGPFIEKMLDRLVKKTASASERKPLTKKQRMILYILLGQLIVRSVLFAWF